MSTRSFACLLVLVLVLLVATVQFGIGQAVTATVSTNRHPTLSTVNPDTNVVYVLADCSGTCPPGTGAVVNVINGSTLSVQTVAVGYLPSGLTVNRVTNKVYVANRCNDWYCYTNGTLTIIDGSTLATQTIQLPDQPAAIAVNPATNKIYLACRGAILVVDGSSLTIQTISVRYGGIAVAVNSATNKIYVLVNLDWYAYGYVTVLDGATLATQNVVVGHRPLGLALDTSRNEIFVVNDCGEGSYCQDSSVTVIDGSTLASYPVEVGYSEVAIAVNSTTHQVYVASYCTDWSCSTGSLTKIDEDTLRTNSVVVEPAAGDVKVDEGTNMVYVATNQGDVVSAVDGTSLSNLPVSVGDSPTTLSLNPQTHQIYASLQGDAAVAIIGGQAKLQFTPMTPCRVIDTRSQGGPIQGRTAQNFYLQQSPNCTIPSTAAAYSLNVTVVPRGSLGYLTIWPAGRSQPLVSTMNSIDGRVKANAAIVQAGVGGAVSVYVSDTSDVVLDINGYFAPASQQTYQFFPLAPCRLVDTRTANGDLGGPYLAGGVERDFPFAESSCIPHNVSMQAYSLNVTAVPHTNGHRLGYLTVWPAGASRPVVSTLNNPTGTYVANAALVKAGTSGSIAVYPDQDTDVVIDVNGYFAAPGQGGVAYYPASACRVIDTRVWPYHGAFSGEMTVSVAASGCSVPASSSAYALNATVVPAPTLTYLTLWADGRQQPLTSTLNALDGQVTSNLAIVPNGDGMTDAYASGTTDLVLDLAGFFAP